MSSHSKDRALALVPAGAAVAAGARAAAASTAAAARASAVGCRRLYHEERIHRVYTSVRANSPRVKRPELPCL